jgi:membrane protease YdiL (CAAX protease family)
MKNSGPTPNRKVFMLLWKAARRRSDARKQRQRELMSRKSGSQSNSLGCLMQLLGILVMLFLHAALAWMFIDSIKTAQVIEAERGGKVVVSSYMIHSMSGMPGSDPTKDVKVIFFDIEARQRARELGGNEESQRELLTKHYETYGADGFVDEDKVSSMDFSKPTEIPPSVWILGGFVILWWLTMIVCQGEGLEMDIQRRRHPMWEWIQSHPVRPVAAFAADLLSPMVANPVYFSAPIFWGMIFGYIYNPLIGLLLSLPIGLGFALAASALNKALEISVMLRMAPRNRGAVLGLISWLGYAGMMLPLFSINAAPVKVFLAQKAGAISEIIPGFPMRWILVGWGNEASAWQAGIVGLLAAIALLAFAIGVAWWGAKQGLQGGNSRAPSKSEKRDKPSEAKFLSGNPLYRKEMLWFWRDKGAVIQALLIPLTIASFQVFNLRGLMSGAVGSWNGISGAAIVCGTYFLLVLGPRSLASEGAALWVATTWPRGLEDLLKAKARLWWFFSSAIVFAILAVAVWMFPADWSRILLVAFGWTVFGKSLAEKAVTLATVASSSGEPEPAPKGRQWAAMLGTFVFSAGVFTANWSLAVVGVIFSTLTASAMWQNFRARLPYLFDPWSEKLPPAPSLMHSMIAIAAMVEGLGLFTVLIHAFSVEAGVGFARTMAYGVVGLIAWGIMSSFLANRGVTGGMIWRWERGENTPNAITSYAGALVIGAVLAGFAVLYLAGLRVFPPTVEFMRSMDAMASADRGLIYMTMIMAVGMAPLAEEFLFRGLLFRALDREKGGIAALLWSSAYFAIYHPPVSWLPVFLVGVGCAWLYKMSGRLGPSVLLHMTYNAIVIVA